MPKKPVDHEEPCALCGEPVEPGCDLCFECLEDDIEDRRVHNEKGNKK